MVRRALKREMGVVNQFLQLASGKQSLLHVVKTEKAYEERRLERSTWVSTTISGVYQELAKIEGFKMLLAYIMGQNEEGIQLKMMPPVLTRVTSPKNKSFESSFTVSLCVQTGGEDKRLPEPTDPLVYIEQFPAMNMFVKSVDGLTNDEKWLWEARKLAEILQHKEHIRTDVYFTASYENPLQLMCQHNEVWLVKYENEGAIVPFKKENTINIANHRLPLPPIAVKILSFVIASVSLLFACFNACFNLGSFMRSNAGLLHKTLKATIDSIAKRNAVFNFVVIVCLACYNRCLSLLQLVNKIQ